MKPNLIFQQAICGDWKGEIYDLTRPSYATGSLNLQPTKATAARREVYIHCDDCCNDLKPERGYIHGFVFRQDPAGHLRGLAIVETENGRIQLLRLSLLVFIQPYWEDR